MEIFRAPKARGVKAGGWTLQTVEVDIEREVYYPPISAVWDPKHPVEFDGETYPQHVKAQWTRHPDGLQVIQEVRSTERDGPVLLALQVSHPEGVRKPSDYRLPFLTMARKAAASHRLGVAKVVFYPQDPVKDPEAQQERLEDIARWWHEGNALKKLPRTHPDHEPSIARYIQKRLERETRQTRDGELHDGSLSESRIYHLIGQAERAGALDKSKGANP